MDKYLNRITTQEPGLKYVLKLVYKKKARNLRALCSKVYLVRILKVDLEAKMVSFILFQYINIV